MYETDGAIASDLEFPLTAQSTPFSKGLGQRHHTNKTIVQISDSDPFRGCLRVDPFEYVPLCQNHATPDELVSIYRTTSLRRLLQANVSKYDVIRKTGNT